MNLRCDIQRAQQQGGAGAGQSEMPLRRARCTSSTPASAGSKHPATMSCPHERGGADSCHGDEDRQLQTRNDSEQKLGCQRCGQSEVPAVEHGDLETRLERVRKLRVAHCLSGPSTGAVPLGEDVEPRGRCGVPS